MSLGVFDDVAALFSKLEGKTFQQAVCRELQAAFRNFQPVPDLSGDGGVDGLTHGNTHAYLCYGPKLLLRTKKLANKELAKDITNKYTADFQRIFGVSPSGKGIKRQLIQTPNTKLPGVLGKGIRLKQLYLALSYFQDPSIIGDLRSAFDECKNATKADHVESDIDFAVWGPVEIAQHCSVDEASIHRLKYPAFHANIGPAVANAPPVPPSPRFDQKLDWFLSQPKIKAEKIDDLRKRLRDTWSQAVAIDQTISETMPDTHRQLARIRDAAIDLAINKSITPATGPDQAIERMESVQKLIGEKLKSLDIGVDFVEKLTRGETAKLIGECHLDWT